ncbi:MAG TPA: uroporphyrinogen decarboxylase family protein [bacterium]|nr:uroporphyrinogen decarboxylase family protein [bacterium]HOM27213.1 uroporphyrinogen decarboxylase family protein [bacterium]
MKKEKKVKIDEKEVNTKNFLKAVLFDYPDWIPVGVGILPAAWFKYKEGLEKILLSHPVIFPNYKKGSFENIRLSPEYKKGKFVDIWGITWENLEEGICGAPVEELAPLKNWNDFENYKFPDPLKYDRYGNQINWEEIRKNLENLKKQGKIAGGGLFHGSMYMQLYYLRGFENFMIDIATEEPNLEILINIVFEYNMKIIEKWIEIGAEMIYFGDDLGLQKSLPISPEKWRKYIKPPYKKMFEKCVENGLIIYLHSDGYILDIIPDLIECGLDMVNPQIRPNTLKGIEKYCKGKIAVNLDLDRQLFPFATKNQIEDHIKEAIDTLALPEGGLSLSVEIGPDVPLEIIETICSTLEKLNCHGW